MSSGLTAGLMSYRRLIVVLIGLTLALLPAQQAMAASGLYGASSGVLPDANQSSARHSLRLHDGNGNNPVVKLRVYSDVGVSAPANNTGPTIQLNMKKCKEYYSGASITAANSTPSGGSNCKLPQYITVNGGAWHAPDPNINRYWKEADLVLTSGSSHVVEFTIQMLSGGYYIGYGANTNPQWTAVNDRDHDKTTYTVEFATPPCQEYSTPGQVGIYDPNHNVKLKLYETPRTSGSYPSSPIKSKDTGEDEKGLEAMSFTVNPSMKYKFTAQTTHDNDTISMYWPYDTVFASVANCITWQVAVSSTAKTSSNATFSTNNTVLVNPDMGPAGSGSITWSHTATETTNYKPTKSSLTLSYQWTTSHPWQTPVPPISPVTGPIAKGGSVPRSMTFNVPYNTLPGTKYCQRMISSDTNSADSTDLPSIPPACVTVVWPATRPYFQALGGDVNSTTNSVPPGFLGSIRGWDNPPNRQLGALGQVAALARGTIAGFPNANGVGGGNRLSFAHPSLGGPGNFCTNCYTPESLPTTTESGNVTISGYDPTNYTRKVAGNIYINGPINNPASFGLNDLKFTRLVATGNIYIHPDVTNIDAILQAGNAIYTCAFGFSPPTAQQIARECRRAILPGTPQTTGPARQPLRINGAMSAKYIKLFRSTGSVNQPNPAETIDYVPMAWLQALSGVDLNGLSGSYDAYTSLPPVL